MTIILFIILLSVIITIHEAGHLIAAKIFGVYCYEFSFGMGPLLWQKKTEETKYSLRALPIGGYVSMAGEADGDAVYPDVTVPEGRRLTDQKTWKKVIIMLAGVMMNFLLAWLILSLVILGTGVFRSSPPAVVNEVVAGSPAEAAGFMSGDRIVKITKEDGSSVKPKTYLDMQAFSSGYDGTETYVIQRGDEEFEVSVRPEWNEESQSYLIGIIGPDAEIHEVNLLNCWYYGFAEMGIITGMMLTIIMGLFRGSGLDQLSGPVGIYQATETYAKLGFSSYMLLVGQLSLNVGIFNLLPLPVLDGGQIVLALCEGAVGKPLNSTVKTVIMAACWVLLISIMLFATWNDIARLLR
ncbi:MAG: M50 family metallopeptidase [Solobacterium sp.]|nr:M50 family metallopeptidase [Solobacterium sp.]